MPFDKEQEALVTSSCDDDAESSSRVAFDTSPPSLPAECNLLADKVSYSCAPPIAQPLNDSGTAKIRTMEDDACASRQQSRSPRKSLSSTSLLSSIVLHVAAALILALILVPTNFGGTRTLSILVTTEEPVLEEDLAPVEMGFSETPQALEKPPTILPTPLKGLLSPVGQKSIAANPLQSVGPRGSFFGIEAEGLEFVYVLDMSVSMQGQRFDRASAELMRSVYQLGSNQKFFVILFCAETRQMFDGSDSLPKPISATPENKERLAKWLYSTSLAGGTDPREALKVATRINPAAIFMLSDGEFNNGKILNQEVQLRVSSDCFSIVKAAPGKPPIHTIAFEDEKSQENMRRLAEMTSGQFRFVGHDEGASPKDSMRRIRTAMQQGDLATAEIFFREAVANLAEADGEGATQSKIELAKIMFELAENGLKKGELEAARRALVDNANTYPKDEKIEEIQTTLVGNLLDRLNSDLDGAAAVASLLTEFVKKSPKSPAAKRIYDSLGQAFIDEARQLYAEGEYLKSIRKLEIAIATFPEWAAVSDCQGERDRIAKELLDEAEELRQQRGNDASTRYLRRLASQSEGTQFHTEVIEFMNEQKAQEIFQRAIKLEKPATITKALGLYRTIVNDFSNTRAAEMARERMRMMGEP